MGAAALVRISTPESAGPAAHYTLRLAVGDGRLVSPDGLNSLAHESQDYCSNIAVCVRTQATASLILAVYDDSVPFMGDEALLAVCKGRDYTIKAFVAFRQKVLAKVKQLTAAAGGSPKKKLKKSTSGSSSNSSGAVTCRLIEQVLWCNAVEDGSARGTCFKKKKPPAKKKALGGAAKVTGRKRKGTK